MDIRTLVIINLLLSSTLCALFFVMVRDRGVAAMRSWGYLLLWLSAGLLLHSLRGRLPDLIPVLVGNGALLVAALFAERSARELNEEEVQDTLGWSVAALTVLGLGILHFAVPDLRWRGLLFSLAASFLLSRAALRFYQSPTGYAARERSIMALLLLLWGMIHFVRAIHFAGSPPWTDFFAPSLANSAIFLPGVMFVPAASICLIWMELASISAKDAGAGVARAAPPPVAPIGTLPGGVHDPRTSGTLARVLIVDDNAGHRETTAELVGSLGYETRQASDADTAQTQLESNIAPPDVMLLTVVVPGPGLELARRLRESHPKLIVILLTVNASARDSLMSEGFPVILQPFTGTLLSAMLEAQLARRASAESPVRPEPLLSMGPGATV